MLLDGRAEGAPERRLVAEQAGDRNSNKLHTSPRLFSSGVPVSAKRWRALMRWASADTVARGFLMACASSRMATWNSWSSSTAWSRISSGYVVSTRSWWRMSPNRCLRSSPRSASTSSVGTKRSASACQFGSTLVGATMSAGRSRRPSTFSRARKASACTVLPRPMSSASTPPKPVSRRKSSQASPRA